MQEEETRPSEAESEGGPRDLALQLRRVAHDINGALNTLVLNLELLDRATATRDAAAEGARSGARERSLASLRRAVSEIQKIVGGRLLALAGGDSDPASGAR
jgi:hypothetical protein